ncbi:MAG: hypothetical protein VW935_18710 [Novosphingobium sp.]
MDALADVEDGLTQEADEILLEYPHTSPADLAASFERTIANYDGDRDMAVAIIAELRRRADAGVRLWPSQPSAPEATDAITDDDIPW